MTTAISQKLRLGVIFGGASGEHEVSVVSAQHVMAAVDRERFDVVPVGVSKTGTWLIESGGLSPTVAELAPFIKGFTLFFWAIGTVLFIQFPPLAKNVLSASKEVASLFLVMFSVGVGGAGGAALGWAIDHHHASEEVLFERESDPAR